MKNNKNTTSSEEDHKDKHSPEEDLLKDGLPSVQDQEEYFRRKEAEEAEEGFEREAPYLLTEAIEFVAFRVLCGIVVGATLATLYALYSPPSTFWVAGGIIYGLLSGLAWIVASVPARHSMYLIRYDALIAGFVATLFTAFAPQAVASVLNATFLAGDIWSSVYLGTIILCLGTIFALKFEMMNSLWK